MGSRDMICGARFFYSFAVIAKYRDGSNHAESDSFSRNATSSALAAMF